MVVGLHLASVIPKMLKMVHVPVATMHGTQHYKVSTEACFVMLVIDVNPDLKKTEYPCLIGDILLLLLLFRFLKTVEEQKKNKQKTPRQIEINMFFMPGKIKDR